MPRSRLKMKKISTHCASRGSRTIRHPETGFSINVQRNFCDLTGKTVNGKKVIGPSRRSGNRVYFDILCGCGRRYESLLQSVRRSTGCQMCSHRDPRPYRRLRPYEAQYNNFKKRARHACDLTYEQYAEIARSNQSCHYCNAGIVWKEWRGQNQRGGSGSNLDRKDYTKGYTYSNVVPCCGRCNYAKGTHFSYEEWVEIGNLIKSWNDTSGYVVTPQSGRALAVLQLELEGE